MSRFAAIVPFATKFRLERLIVNASRQLELQVRIDHRNNSLSFGTDLGVSQKRMPSETILMQLTHLAVALQKAGRTLQPRDDERTNVAGVMYLIRYEDTGFDDVRTALREQQTVMHSHQGSIIGIARPSHICVLEGLEEWTPARCNSPKPNLSVSHSCVDEGMAVLWSPSYERANDFSNNSYTNRFRNMDFPTPMGTDIFTLQMNNQLYQKELDTFLVFELLEARRYSAETLQHFEEEVKERMLGFNKNCFPLVVSHFIEMLFRIAQTHVVSTAP